MKKLFIYLFLSFVVLPPSYGMGTFTYFNPVHSDLRAPEFFQELGNEAQMNMGIREELRTDIFLFSRAADFDEDLVKFDPKSKKISIFSNLDQMNICMGNLRFLFHREAVKKLLDSKNVVLHGLYKDQYIDLISAASCGCYKCIEEYCKPYIGDANLKTLSDELQLEANHNYIIQLLEKAHKFKEANKVCKYHRNIFIKTGSWLFNLVQKFFEPFYFVE